MNRKLLLAFLPLFFCGLTYAQVPSYVPTSGLVGWWDFVGGAQDKSTNAMHGTVTGAVPTTDRNGNPASAYSFNANAAHKIEIPIGSSSSGGISGNFSAVMWVKANRTVTPVANSSLCPGSVSVPMANSNQNWAMVPPNFGLNSGVGFSLGTNGVFVGHHANNYLVCKGSYLITNTQFYFIGITQDGNTSNLYVNGAWVSTLVGNCTNSLKYLSNIIELGGDMYSPGFSGVIDDFGVWGRTLTHAEITQMYVGQATPSAPTAIANQYFCSSSSIGQLSATGSNVKWYSSLSGGSQLSATATLVHGTTYFASQTVNGIESVTRTPVRALIINPPLINQNDTVCLGQSTTLGVGAIPAPSAYPVGSIGPGGGYIFYDKQVVSNGWRYLEVARDDYASPVPFGCTTTNISGTLTSLGAALNNTNALVNGCAALNTPARLCNDAIINGLSDWVLPSKDDFQAIYQNIHLAGLGGFINNNGSQWNRYWTSSQINSNLVWAHDFTPYYQQIVPKSDQAKIRPVRQFAAETFQPTYLWSTGETSSSITVTPASNINNYWVDITLNGTTCRKYFQILTTSTPAPTGNAIQSVSSNATLTQLAATGTNIKWYAAATGGTMLNLTTPLVNGQSYFATQTINGCESANRLQVTVNMQNVQVSVSSDTVCSGTSVSLSALLGGSSSQAVPVGGVYYLTDGNPQTFPVDVNGWQYIAITKDANGNGKIYKNGVEVVSAPFTSRPYNWSRIDIGGEFYTSWQNLFDGLVDELRYSNVVRTPTEIAAHYQSQLPMVSDNNTLGLYRFDALSNGQIVAAVGPNGTATNAVYNAAGRFGGAIDFNGTNARGTIPLNVPESNITLEFWVKPRVADGVPVSLYGMYTTSFYLDVSTPTNSFTSNANICGPLPGSLSTGLSAWYPFCGNANDLSGNNRNGTVSGATLDMDRFGNPQSAYSFNTNQQITIPGTAAMNNFPMTISLWYRADPGLLVPGVSCGIFSKYSPAAWNGYMVGINQSGTSYAAPSWYIRNGSNRVLGNYNEPTFEQTNVQANVWYHYAFVVDQTGGKIYVNGQLVDSHPWTGTPGASSSSFLWKIGGLYDTWFKGKIDDVGIWNRALSTSEVVSMYALTGATYVWSTGATTPTIQVNPTVTTQYWVDVTANGSTTRKYVTVYVTNSPAPSGNSVQTVCHSGTLAQLSVTGTNIQWYAASQGGTPLPLTTNLVNGAVYYASQTVDGCESPRLAVQAILNIPNAPSGNSQQAFCHTATVAQLVATGAGLKWYPAALGGSPLALTTPLVNGATYYASQTLNNCESTVRLAVNVVLLAPAVPTGPASQSVCTSGTVSQLAPQGTGIQWFNSASGGTPLSSNTALVHNSVYFASQFAGGCESTSRLAVHVTLINATVVSSNDTVCVNNAATLAALPFGPPAACAAMPSSLATGLSAWYPFCGNANDYSGNNRNGSVSGATLDFDRFGNPQSSYAFNTNQQITVPGSSTLNHYPLTISLWYQADPSLLATGVAANVFSKYSPAAWNGYQILVNTDGSNYHAPAWYIRNGSNRVLGDYGEPSFQQSSLQSNVWYHYVFVLDQTGGKIYVNGQLVDSHPWTGTPGASTNNFQWKIGGFYNTWFKGKIDDVGIWNRALSTSEVTSLYNLSESASFAWSTGSTSPTIQVTPATTTQYWVDVTVNGTTCRKYFTQYVNPGLAPTGLAQQTFCPGSTIAQLSASGAGIKWYNSSTSGAPLPSTTPLLNGVTYYASQTVAGCESSNRLAVQVTLVAPAAPTGATSQAFCNTGTIGQLAAVGSTLKWYSSSTGGTPLVNTTPLANNTTYFASQTVNGCESTSRLPVLVQILSTPAPTGTSIQSFCHAATVSQLAASGNAVVWYAAATGGAPLPGTTPLIGQGVYYATQNLNGCESMQRFAVTVNMVAPTAPTGNSSQVFCNTSTVAQLLANGSGIKWYSSPTGGTALLGTTPLSSGIYYASQTVNGCESLSRLAVVVTLTNTPAPNGLATQNFCQSATVAQLTVSGFGVKWYTVASGGTPLTATTGLTNGTTYYASQTVNGCESLSRLAVAVVIQSPQAPAAPFTQNFCYSGTVGQLNAVGQGILWYSSVTGGTALPANTPLVNGTTYFGSQTINGCESQGRVAVNVVLSSPTAPVAANPTQVFCSAATVSQLVVNGTNVKWYDASSAGNLLASVQVLVNGTTYYASQTINGCESTVRTPVIAIINVTLPPSGSPLQTFCDSAKVSQLVAQGTQVKWYLTSTGGSPLLSNTPLVNGVLYYATQVLNGCESDQRFTTMVLLSPSPAGVITTSDPLVYCTNDVIQTNFVVANLNPSFASLQWRRNGVPLVGQTQANYTALLDGSYDVVAVSTPGCTKVFAGSTIVQYPSPMTGVINGLTTPVAQDTATYNVAGGSGNATYTWSVVGGTILSGQGTPSIDVLWNTSGYVAIYAASPNCMEQDTLNVQVSGLGVGEGNGSEYQLFPNPSSGSFRILGLQEEDVVVLYTLDGKEITSMRRFGDRFDLPHVPSGVYQLHITTAMGDHRTMRVVISH
jgi:hypothetical protein